MSGELRNSQFRYTTTPDDDFVIGSPYNAALKTPKYLVFQVNTAMGYGSNPHLRCQWMDGVNSWRLRFSHDGITVNDFALTNAENIFEATNTFSGAVSFNNSTSFNSTVNFESGVTAPTMPETDRSLAIANTTHVKQVIERVTVNSASNTVVANDTALAQTVYPTWVAWSSSDPNGYFPQKVSSTKLSFNPSTGVLSATTFSGSGANLTNVPASSLVGSFSNVSFNLGTTSVALNRASAEMGLTGITSLTGSTVSIGTTTATSISVGTGAVTNTTTVDGSVLNLGNSKASTVNLGTATTTQTINIGTGSGVTTINLGGSGDTVNIAGTLTYVNTTDLNVTDKLITLNKGGASASGNASGISIEENGNSLAGYAQVGNSRNSWDFKAPAKAGLFRFTPNTTYITEIIPDALTDNNHTITLPNASGTVSLVGHTHVISNVTDATTLGQNLVKIPNQSGYKFLRINSTAVEVRTAEEFRADIGAGTSSTVGTVTSVGGTGTVSGISLSGTVTSSGNLTLSGTLQVSASDFSSQTAKTFLAAPNGAAGVPTFRAIVASDIPVLNQNTTGSSGSCTGNANTATSLQNTRNIAATGEVSWNVNFDGSANVTADATISNSAVIGKLLTGFSSLSGTVSASDSILTGLGRLQGQASALSTSLSGKADIGHTHTEYSPTSHTHTTFGSSIAVTGSITATQDITAFHSSDERLKDEITNLQNALDTVVKLQGVSYKWNDTYKEISGLDVDQDFTYYGFIAQEVQKVIPEMVIERDNGYLALDYNKVAPLLVEAIKEQQNQINELRALLTKN